MPDGKKKPKEAAALEYTAGSTGAPVITALGKGLVAEKILERAKEYNIPIVSDSMLAYALNQLEVGEEIPREFYAIVAQIIVTVSRMDREYSSKISNK